MPTRDGRAYRALSMLENEYQPKLNRRAPFWRPRPVPCWRDVRVPSWNWVHPDYHDGLGMDLTIADRNGAFLSAASSANFAHGELEHTGAMSTFRKLPGYYRITTHEWQDRDIVSPLGTADLDGRAWVMAPTLELLWQLQEAGYWPGITILDSWTCPASVRFLAWTTAVNSDRAEALHARSLDPGHDPAADDCECDACDWYEHGIKEGYAKAVQMWLGRGADGQVKSAVNRPDWYHTLHAQHAATTWRTVWKGVLAGHIPVMMGSVDEVTWDSMDFHELQSSGIVKLDSTGVQLGHWKVKDRVQIGAAR